MGRIHSTISDGNLFFTSRIFQIFFQELFTELKHILVRKSYDQNIEARRSFYEFLTKNEDNFIFLELFSH